MIEMGDSAVSAAEAFVRANTPGTSIALTTETIPIASALSFLSPRHHWALRQKVPQVALLDEKYANGQVNHDLVLVYIPRLYLPPSNPSSVHGVIISPASFSADMT